MGFGEIVRGIRSLKIQGATNVAVWAVKAYLMKMTNSSYRKLISLRPTEPFLRNALKFVKKNPKKNPKIFFKKIKDDMDKIARFGANKIQNNSIVFTHCHASTVIDILKEAKRRKKHFIVHNTETRPSLQGRKTALELAKNNINVEYYIDSAGRVALKKADIFLFGADAITSDGRIVNKIGTEMFCELAKKRGIPVYCCTHSWKFDVETIRGFEEKIEQRNSKEVWDIKNNHIRVKNPSFEFIDPGLVTGIISELGVYNVDNFLQEVRKKYPELF
ncbi:MAG: translation initiation factor eIF-2B [Candidatus Nanoarchaeia archaeon]|nr:translation initiation factor eIF-2B [Candidatus Nanoarchaeia archaeon]